MTSTMVQVLAQWSGTTRSGRSRANSDWPREMSGCTLPPARSCQHGSLPPRHPADSGLRRGDGCEAATAAGSGLVHALSIVRRSRIFDSACRHSSSALGH